MTDQNHANFDPIAEQLRAQLELIRDEETALRKEFAGVQEQWKARIGEKVEARRRAERTLSMLTTGRAIPDPRSPEKRYQVSDQLKEAVVAALREVNGDATATELHNSGVSYTTPTIKKALETLRADGKVRRAGKRYSHHDSRDGGQRADAYALMPDA